MTGEFSIRLGADPNLLIARTFPNQRYCRLSQGKIGLRNVSRNYLAVQFHATVRAAGKQWAKYVKYRETLPRSCRVNGDDVCRPTPTRHFVNRGSLLSRRVRRPWH